MRLMSSLRISRSLGSSESNSSSNFKTKDWVMNLVRKANSTSLEDTTRTSNS